MSKRHITFSRPDEPSFLKKLKQQIGYKEGPTVDTKFEELTTAENLSDNEEEKPQIVVLKEGDLTSEEVAREKNRLEKEAEETRADLSARIIFKAPNNNSGDTSKKIINKEVQQKTSKKLPKNKTILSFNYQDEEEDEGN